MAKEISAERSGSAGERENELARSVKYVGSSNFHHDCTELVQPFTTDGDYYPRAAAEEFVFSTFDEIYPIFSIRVSHKTTSPSLEKL